jgi:putative toxin-antitoxin system antitoxin component (TIGR02293 family)
LKQSNQPELSQIPPSIGLSEFFETRIYPVYIIKEGIPYSVFDLIARLSPFTLQDWSEFLNMSYKSLQRYKTSQSQFKQAQSERILELTEVMSMGEEVFDDTKQFRHWLRTTNYALGNLTPMELLSSSYGKELVLSELVRVDEGIFV